MTKNENFKEYGMPVVVLVAICFVTTLLLALTNSVSEPIIIKNQAITLQTEKHLSLKFTRPIMTPVT